MTDDLAFAIVFGLAVAAIAVVAAIADAVLAYRARRANEAWADHVRALTTEGNLWGKTPRPWSQIELDCIVKHMAQATGKPMDLRR